MVCLGFFVKDASLSLSVLVVNVGIVINATQLVDAKDAHDKKTWNFMIINSQILIPINV